MTYIQRLEDLFKVAGKKDSEKDEEFNILEIIKLDNKFRQTSKSIVQTVKHFDQMHPEVGAAEILAAIFNEALSDLFPHLHHDS